MPKVSNEHKQARRGQILLAACKCFGNKGFHQTTVRDICHEAKLSPGAVYGYFKSKDEILESLAELGRQQTRAALGADQETSPTLRHLLGVVMGFAKADESRETARFDLRLWGEAVHTPKLNRLLRDAQKNIQEPFAAAVRAAQGKGEICDDVDAEAVARIMVALVLGITVQIAIEPEVDLSPCAPVISALFDGSFAGKELR